MKTCALIFYVAVIFILSSCSTPFTYDSVEWRIAVDSPDAATTLVKYSGIGVDSKKKEIREKALQEIREIADDENPKVPLTPGMFDAVRKVYTEDNRIVIEEAGKIKNPLSWFSQTGLNPLSWFDNSVNLTINRNYIIKNVETADGEVIATSGQLMDEDTFETILKGQKLIPLELNRDVDWQTDDFGDEQMDFRKELQVIVWPKSAKSFYWKFSGEAAGKEWQSLADEFKETGK